MEQEKLDRRAKLAAVFLLVLLAVTVVAVLSGLAQYRLIDRAFAGDITPGQADANDRRERIVGIVQFAAFVLAAIFFIRWFAAAYRQLPRLGAGARRFTPGWAIGAWFVPFLNLWRPKQIANDIWRGSDPTAPPGDQGTAWQERPVAPLVHWWWGLFLLSNVVSNLVVRAYRGADTLEEIRTASAVGVVSDALDLVALPLAVPVVRRLAGRQRERGRSVSLAA